MNPRELQSIKQRFGIIGRSVSLDRALSTAARVANTELTVMITGPSGVGKDVFSKIIHSLSARKHNNFIAVNCGAIPEGTINSELFGHEKGAFTGATTDRQGYFESVNGGSIFLDEIGELPLDTQSFLLRVLENGEYIRVGSSKVRKVDVRVVAATNVDLKKQVRNGKFREDLFFRLNTVPIHVPSLRDRQEDIFVLFRKFATDFAEKNRMESIRLTKEAQTILENYPWPGNVRQLKNIAEQISILSEERTIDALTIKEYLPDDGLSRLPVPASVSGLGADGLNEREILYKLLFEMKSDMKDLKSLVFGLISKNNLNVPSEHDRNGAFQLPSHTIDSPDNDIFSLPSQHSNKPVLIGPHKNEFNDSYQKSEVVEDNLSLEDMEKSLIQKALKKHNNKRKEASIDLGISERTLYRKIKQYELG